MLKDTFFHPLRWLSRLILLGWLISLAAHPLLAQTEPPTRDSVAGGESACEAVDVVFLIDQSDSMNAMPADSPVRPNDPTDNRKYAVEVAIDQLGRIALDVCPGLVFRVAVISFGNDARLDLELSAIGPYDPERSAEAFNSREILRRSVVADDLDETNQAAAFELAKQVFDNAAGLPLEVGQVRKRAIVFLTDGEPCADNPRYGRCGNFPNPLPDGWPTGFDVAGYLDDLQDQIDRDFPFSSALLAREQCLKDARATGADDPLLAASLNACLENFPVTANDYNNSTYIYISLLRVFSLDAASAAVYRRISESRAGSLINLPSGREEILTTFETILGDLTGVRAIRLVCGNFAVNPYLRKAYLNFYKFDASISVSIRYTNTRGDTFILENGVAPDGGFQLAAERGYLERGANERYEIEYPYPGVYYLDSPDCDSLDASYIPIGVKDSLLSLPVILPQYDRPPYYNPEYPTYVEFQLTDTSIVIPQADHPRFALEVEGVVRGAGTEQLLTFVRDGETFRSTKPLLAQTPGVYTIEIKAFSYRHEGEVTTVNLDYNEVFSQRYLVQSVVQSYEIVEVTPFVIQIVKPVEGDVYRPIHAASVAGSLPAIAPLDVRLRLADRDGNAVFGSQINNIFRDGTDDIFNATVTDPSGRLVTVPLIRDLDNPGDFIASIPDLGNVGDYNLSVTLKPESFDRNTFYPDNVSDTVSFRRDDETWRFAIHEPADGATLTPIHRSLVESGLRWPVWRLDVEPISIRVELIDAEGNPYTDIESVMAYAPQVLTARLTAGDQNATTELTPDPRNPGQYIGQITDVDFRGRHNLSVDLELSWPEFDPESVPAISAFDRGDTLATSPATYAVLQVVLLIILALLIWRFFAIRRNKIMGELAFLDGGVEIVNFSLHSGKKWKSFRRELRAYPQLELKWLTATSVARENRRGQLSEEGAFDLQAFGAGHPGILVDCDTETGERVRGYLLLPNTPMPVGSTHFMMKYTTPEGE